MGKKSTCELRLFTCVAGISFGLWIGDLFLKISNFESIWELFVIIPICGIVGWINGSFSKVLVNPKLTILNYLVDFVSGIIFGYLIIVMAHAVFPITTSLEEKKCAWVFWITGSLALIVGIFNSAEASVGKYHP